MSVGTCGTRLVCGHFPVQPWGQGRGRGIEHRDIERLWCFRSLGRELGATVQGLPGTAAGRAWPWVELDDELWLLLLSTCPCQQLPGKLCAMNQEATACTTQSPEAGVRQLWM